MNTLKELNKLDQKSLFKCEACGGYHTADESEVVIIRMVKGKNCELTHANRTVVVAKTIDTSPASTLAPIMIPAPNNPINNSTATFKEDAPGEGYHIPPKEMEKINSAPMDPTKRKMIIPPGLARFMIPPGDPRFESQGAKEKRIA